MGFPELIPFTHVFDPKVMCVYSEKYDEYFPPDRCLAFKQTQNNISDVILNNQFSEGSIRPLFSGLLEIGKENSDSLECDILEFLENSNSYSTKGALLSNLAAKTNFLCAPLLFYICLLLFINILMPMRVTFGKMFTLLKLLCLKIYSYTCGKCRSKQNINED